MAYQWQILKDVIPNNLEDLKSLILENRKIITDSDKREFLNPSHPEKLSQADFGLDKLACDKAKNLIESHCQKGNKIAIYGDYDVDGVCATAILWETIYSSYGGVFPHIPHRESEGYGLSLVGIDICISKGAKLIITIDNGITAIKAAQYCKDKGIDLIIVDHHEQGEEIPEAQVILHSKTTCAGALAYSFSQLLSHADPSHLELAAIAIIADMIPLTGVNRSLVKYGLLALRETNRIGLKALFLTSGISPGTIGTYEVGFIIGPRINAMGRIEHAIDSLRLLCTKNIDKAAALARILDSTNRLRQEETTHALEHALASVEKKYGQNIPNILIVSSPEYHQGIVGLIASKLSEKFHRPSIAISEGGEISKGSARSIAGFDITQHLKLAQSLLLSVGGHFMAAGISLKTQNIEAFKDKLISISQEKISSDQMKRVIKIDCKLLLEQVNSSTAIMLKSLEPFGLGNPEPVFAINNLNILESRAVGKTNQHLKLLLTDGSFQIAGIGFNLGNFSSILLPGSKVDTVSTINENSFNGSISLELKIKDVANKS